MTLADSHPYDEDRRDMLRLVPDGVRTALDVGCSTGRFMKLLQQRVPVVWGIEPHPDAARTAAGSGSTVVEGSFPHDLPADAPKFDLVVFNDVLEHMTDPWTCLADTRSLLSDGGWVVASLPNLRNLRVLVDLVWSGRFDYVDTGVLDRTHLRFFTRATIIELFEGAGFDVVRLQRVGGPIGSKSRWATALLPRRAREELRTIQFGVLARPRAGAGPVAAGGVALPT